MKRRDYLKTLSVGVVVPYNTATPDHDTDEPLVTEELSYELDSYAAETGRVFRAYDQNHHERQCRKWTMETVGGEELYHEAYPRDHMETHMGDGELLMHFWQNGDYQGNTRLSLDEDYSYHTHTRDDREDIQHRVHIQTGEFERIQ